MAPPYPNRRFNFDEHGRAVAMRCVTSARCPRTIPNLPNCFVSYSQGTSLRGTHGLRNRKTCPTSPHAAKPQHPEVR